jgi:AcrR family transcriptional regulator/DNA-binding MarR family transcriptional regulator
MPSTLYTRSNGSQRALVGEVQRLWIISAMARSVCQRGLQSVTVAQVITRAGVSRSRFYELFAGTEDCFRATFDQAVALAAESVVPAFEAERRWHERIRAGLQALLVFLDSEPELARVAVVHALQGDARTLERRREVLEQLAQVFEQGRAGSSRAPLPLTAESLVGAVFALLHARLLEHDTPPLIELINPLMAIVVLPYLGPAAAERELARPAPQKPPTSQLSTPTRDLLRDLDMRLTYRTLRVLAAIADAPGISNREVAAAADVQDEGQISKLLARLQRLGLAHNSSPGQREGASNAWTITSRGAQVRRAAGLEQAHDHSR